MCDSSTFLQFWCDNIFYLRIRLMRVKGQCRSAYFSYDVSVFLNNSHQKVVHCSINVLLLLACENDHQKIVSLSETKKKQFFLFLEIIFFKERPAGGGGPYMARSTAYLSILHSHSTHPLPCPHPILSRSLSYKSGFVFTFRN